MDYVQVIGLAAACLTTAGFFPQFWKAYKTKRTKDVSLGMFSLMTLGLFTWLVYGLLVNDLPIIAANFVSVLIAGGILFLKLKYK